jgi:hypothetical protein
MLNQNGPIFFILDMIGIKIHISMELTVNRPQELLNFVFYIRDDSDYGS